MIFMHKKDRIIIDSLQRVIEKSRVIHEKADWWYYKTNAPLSRSEIRKWCRKTGVVLPEAYITCLTVSNGFTVDFASVVGWFHLEPFDPDRMLDRFFTAERKRMFEKGIPFKSCFGWMSHHCIYFDVFTGELFLEQERYHYTPITDFVSEILEPVIRHLEIETERAVRGKQLLLESRNNPMRPLYDELLKFVGDGALPNLNIMLQPPASEAEICRWEQENGIRLPCEYRDWLKLSNGSSFQYKFILRLEHLRKAYPSEFIDGVEYMYLAGISGSFDYLMLNTQTGEYCILTENFELEEAVGFEEEIFEDAFEFLAELAAEQQDEKG